MKREFYAVDYYATETLQNGKERETTQTVYFPCREENGKFTKWSGSFDTMERAEKELKEQHYYKLIYKGTRIVRLNVIAE